MNNPDATTEPTPPAETGEGFGASSFRGICPSCGSPETKEGKPSRRTFFGCGSYTYDGEMEKLRDQTEVCQLRARMQEAWKLVNAMAGQEYWDRAEEWLKENSEFQPEGAERV